MTNETFCYPGILKVRQSCKNKESKEKDDDTIIKVKMKMVV